MWFLLLLFCRGGRHPREPWPSDPGQRALAQCAFVVVCLGVLFLIAVVGKILG